MAALSEELARLTNPTPFFQDPEDNEDETSAKVVGLSGAYDEDYNVEEQVSSLRRKAAISLPIFDKKYAGKRISRKNLLIGESINDSDQEDEVDDDDDDEEEEDGDEDDLDSYSDAGKNEDIEENDEDLKAFQSKISKIQVTAQPSFSFEDDGDFSKYADMDEDDDSNEDNEDDDSEEEDEDESAEEENKNKEERSPPEESGVSSFSKSSIEEEIQKGKAAKAQLSLWDGLLENRIQIQKIVGLVNQLPQCDTWQAFVKEDDFSSKAESAHLSLCKVLNKLIELQSYLLLQNTDTQQIITGETPHNSSKEHSRSDDADDEEITSESDLNEEDNDEEPKNKAIPRSEVKELMAKTGLKRKLQSHQYPEFLAKRHTDFTEFRNTTIQKWYDKTRLIGGNKKSFSSFDKSAVKQIQQIMNDKQRLIKRTQLKRTMYHILGKTDTEDKDPTLESIQDVDLMSVGDNNLKNYDPEIFDDSDFYHQQLRELIELKTQDTSDPLALSRQWLEIHKLRRKVKKKVDTRASKGRKVRYDVHKKLMNFMAPVDISAIPEESRDDLFKSLFGKRFQNSNLEKDVDLET